MNRITYTAPAWSDTASTATVAVDQAEAPEGWFDSFPEVPWHLGNPRNADDFRAFIVHEVRFVDGVGYTDDDRARQYFTWLASRPTLTADSEQRVDPGAAGWDAWRTWTGRRPG